MHETKVRRAVGTGIGAAMLVAVLVQLPWMNLGSTAAELFACASVGLAVAVTYLAVDRTRTR